MRRCAETTSGIEESNRRFRRIACGRIAPPPASPALPPDPNEAAGRFAGSIGYVIPPIELSPDIRLRTLERADAETLAAAHRLNREYLAPWEPLRSPGFYTAHGQLEAIGRQVADRDAGRSLPWVLATTDEVIGQATLSGITHGAFESAALGYWIDQRYQGRGLMTRALTAVVEVSRSVLGLHRLEAQTLPVNEASQHLLGKLGFERIGYAPRYLRIAGQWQDHVMYQLILAD